MPIRRLALLTTFAALLVAHPAVAGAACAGADELPNAQNGDLVAQATLCLINEQRTAAGLHALTASEPLAKLSAAYGAYMVDHQYFEHTTPSGVTFEKRLAIIGYDWQEAGENLAWGQGTLSTPAERVTAWMDSPPHRANILHAAFREIGIGIALGAPVANAPGSATYVTDFGTPEAGTATLRNHVAPTATVARRPVAHLVAFRRVSWSGRRSDRWWRHWLRRHVHHHGHHGHHRHLRFVG